MTPTTHSKPHPALGYVVGRKQEVRVLRDMVREKSPCTILNLYGPGGIGKTVVAQLFQASCAEWELPCAVVRGDDLTAAGFDELLRGLRSSLGKNPPGLVRTDVFREFDNRLKGYEKLKNISDSGEVNRVFDAAGRLVNQAPLQLALGLLQETYQGLATYLQQKDNFQRYLDGADTWLTKAFADSLARLAHQGRHLVLIIDTYERMADWDDWLCRRFAPALPPGVKLVVVGREKLGPDWRGAYPDRLKTYELKELSEAEAKTYLRHYELHDDAALDRVYAFTGGYPLCLVLAVELARDNQGMNWDRVQGLEHMADRAQIATQLLERLLQQPGVQDVRPFLERGTLAEWFNPAAVSYLLEVEPARGAEIYETMLRFSFVQRVSQGAKLHDQVRKLLAARMQFNNPAEFRRQADRWHAYLQSQAGL